MLGTFRLMLAIAVAYSHSGVEQEPLWLGVMAVVGFFVISGFAMTALIEQRFARPRSAAGFYAERYLRLAPQYYFWIVVSAIIIVATPWWPVVVTATLPYDIVQYILVLPLGMQFGILRPFPELHTFLMPQATSLGLETLFYLLSPWMLRSRALSWVATLCCLAIFSATAINVLPSNIFTYYCAPGPMLFYLIGSFPYRKDWVSLMLLVGSLCLILAFNIHRHFELEFAVGLILAVPVVAVLGGIRWRRRGWDTALGNASYGCFLSHVAIFAVVKGIAEVNNLTPGLRVVGIGLAVLAGFASYYVIERPTIPLRRRFGQTSPAAPAFTTLDAAG